MGVSTVTTEAPLAEGGCEHVVQGTAMQQKAGCVGDRSKPPCPHHVRATAHASQAVRRRRRRRLMGGETGSERVSGGGFRRANRGRMATRKLLGWPVLVWPFQQQLQTPTHTTTIRSLRTCTSNKTHPLNSSAPLGPGDTPIAAWGGTSITIP